MIIVNVGRVAYVIVTVIIPLTLSLQNVFLLHVLNPVFVGQTKNVVTLVSAVIGPTLIVIPIKCPICVTTTLPF